MPKQKQAPIVLLVLDGWGITKQTKGNAIALAKKPQYDKLLKQYPHTQLRASGVAVGLPKNQSGNSEAGHLNIGAGRVVKQDAVVISESIADLTFNKNPAFQAASQHVMQHGSTLHLIGLLSNGQSGHSNPHHVRALIDWSRREKINKTLLHVFTDGRDSHPREAMRLVTELRNYLRNEATTDGLRGEWIATLMGRFYAMDRKKDWSRTERAYHAMVCGEGERAESPLKAITQAYNRNETDEYIQPYILHHQGKPIGTINDDDAVIFFNLRSDRARQMTKPFVQKDFNKKNPGAFRRKKVLHNLLFVALTEFGPDLDHILTAYPSAPLNQTLPFALAGLRQIYIAESEKYAHVTYFFNGGHADPIADEERRLVPSPDIDSYDQQPAMSVHAVADEVVTYLATHDFIMANFANADMVGHTGNLAASIKAVEEIDKALSTILAAAKKYGATVVITADHGNAERKLDLKTGEMYTEHTRFPVPFILIEPKKIKRTLRAGKLADVAPTILKLMGMPQPPLMTGRALF